MRMKGKCEEELRRLAFQSVSIFRPSLLLGNRKEFRLGEKMSKYLMKLISIFLIGPLRKYKAIESGDVAQAMYQAAQQGRAGYRIYESDEIKQVIKG